MRCGETLTQAICKESAFLVQQAKRQRMLQWWEREHMALQDENRHRPKYLQEKATKQQKHREREQMAKHDKNQHRSCRLRIYTPEEIMTRPSIVVFKHKFFRCF